MSRGVLGIHVQLTAPPHFQARSWFGVLNNNTAPSTLFYASAWNLTSSIIERCCVPDGNIMTVCPLLFFGGAGFKVHSLVLRLRELDVRKRRTHGQALFVGHSAIAG